MVAKPLSKMAFAKIVGIILKAKIGAFTAVVTFTDQDTASKVIAVNQGRFKLEVSLHKIKEAFAKVDINLAFIEEGITQASIKVGIGLREGPLVYQQVTKCKHLVLVDCKHPADSYSSTACTMALRSAFSRRVKVAIEEPSFKESQIHLQLERGIDSSHFINIPSAFSCIVVELTSLEVIS